MSVTHKVDLANHLGRRLEKKPLLLMTHLVVGYPSLDANWAMLEAMDGAGVDLVELQMPFSEPIADGPSFVKANHEAIQAGTTWQDYFDPPRAQRSGSASRSSSWATATASSAWGHSASAKGCPRRA